MEQRIESLVGSEAIDVFEKRRWVKEHYEPEAKYQYETLEGKLRLLDAILKGNWIDPSDTLKLQCLGITFGDALAQKLGLKWVTVEDEYGRDPALILEGTSIITFPLTAISKRIQAGEVVDVHTLFQSACKTISEFNDEMT
jgi:Domain of unknown function (DUF3806)